MPDLPEDAALPEEIMWEGRFITAKRRGRWEYVGRARNIGAAVILAIDEDADGSHVILVDQYRVPLGGRCVELPAGLVGDDESIPAEAPALAATRELEEETGYRARIIKEVGRFFSSPGMVSESFTLFHATELEKVSAGGGIDDEDIIVHRVPLDRLSQWISEKRSEGYAMDVKLLLLLGEDILRPR